LSQRLGADIGAVYTLNHNGRGRRASMGARRVAARQLLSTSTGKYHPTTLGGYFITPDQNCATSGGGAPCAMKDDDRLPTLPTSDGTTRSA